MVGKAVEQGGGGFALVSPFGFWPCDGGLLELSGVFGGSFSFSRSVAFSAFSAAFSALNAAFSASKAETRAASASNRAISTPISVSFSDEERQEMSGGRVMERLTHIRPSSATEIYIL